jgi:hypothetical protein
LALVKFDAEVRVCINDVDAHKFYVLPNDADISERVRSYEAELRDAAEFEEWRQQRMAEDEAQEQCLIRQRKEDAAKAAEAAAAAYARRQKENLQLGHAVKVTQD